MNTNSHAIELTVISGEELYLNQRQRVKKNAFVVVRTHDTGKTDDQRTHMDQDGGSYPVWNEKLVLNLPLRASNFTVEAHCHTREGDKVVGTAKIPTSDFLGGYVPEGYLHFLSYRLIDGFGKKNGIINLSLRVKSPKGKITSLPSCSQPCSGVSVDAKVSNGIVAMGFPVGYKS